MKPIEVKRIDLCNYMHYIGQDVVVIGDVVLHKLGLNELPNINFIKVYGDFYCSCNKLKNLIGAPKEVYGNFKCSMNKLSSLEGCPKKIGGSFFCAENPLKSLKGAPETVLESFYCYNCKLKTLEDSPIFVGGDFCCNFNKLKSLDNCSTEHIGGNFYCHHNNLINVDCHFKYLGGGIQFFTEDLALKYKINIINERFKKLKVLHNSQKCKLHI